MIKQYDVNQSYEFTAHEIHEGVNRAHHSSHNIKQIRVAIRGLIESAKVEKVGEKPYERGAGRPQHVYSATSILRRIEAETAPNNSAVQQGAKENGDAQNSQTDSTEVRVGDGNAVLDHQHDADRNLPGNDSVRPDLVKSLTPKTERQNVSAFAGDPLKKFNELQGDLAKATSGLSQLHAIISDANNSFNDNAIKTGQLHDDILTLHDRTIALIEGQRNSASAANEAWRNGYKAGFADGMRMEH